MHHRRFPLSRAVWTLCACLLLFPGLASAAKPCGWKRLDKCVKGDVLSQNRRAPSVCIRLSASHIGDVIHTKVRRLFRSPRPRCALSLKVTETHRHGLDDGDEESSDTTMPTTFAPFIPLLSPLPRAPDLVASHARAPHTAPAYRSLTTVYPFLPRPPPFYPTL